MKKRLPRVICGGAVFLIAVILFAFIRLELFWLELALYILAFVIIGGDIIYKAIRNIFRGRVFNENFLMSLASVGAFFIGEFPEAVFVMLFYQVGEIFQDYAVGKSRRSIAGLMDIRPDYANLKSEDGLKKVDPEEVRVGDVVVVQPGERIPLDGIVLEGRAAIDMSALTGESLPRDAAAGSEILSGGICLDGVLTVRVQKEFGESTVSKILNLVENASDKKSKQEAFITRFAKYYTPAVVLAAVLLAVVPPLIWPTPTLSEAFLSWTYRALTFLVVSCPCALVISVPMSFFGGIGGASKLGVLIKGSNYLEALAKTETVVFDKTGTLTKGIFRVQALYPAALDETALLETAALAESYSSHPISQSLKTAYGADPDLRRVGDVQEIAGRGVRAAVDGKTVLAGNALLLEDHGIRFVPVEEPGTVVYIAIDGAYGGAVLIADEMKPDAASAIAGLKAAGIKRTVMLTGDNEAAGRAAAVSLGLDEAYTQLLPADKVERMEVFLAGKSKNGTVAFIGDGINDAPVLARADVGIAMGGVGSDAAIEAADVVIMTDEPSKIAAAIAVAKKTRRIATQNIVFALSIKAAVLILSVLNLANMWLAVFADVGVSFLAILNAFRALRVR
ncbi:MAG: cadmium-translocating P-type ATPase [Clostridiales bacterium]|jgi:Cd2+/Zn2+-exporting ATPase|nr:cadmium-translocating P-type ATPase [Clostridiales bacterium]